MLDPFLETIGHLNHLLMGGKPLKLQLGSVQIIKGFDQGLIGMCKGETRQLYIPPALGFGDTRSDIVSNADLVYKMELLEIESANE